MEHIAPWWWFTVDTVELPLADVRYPDLIDIHNYWNAKRGDRFAPGRRDIDPAEMVAVLPRITLVDVQREPLDFRFRLVGTGICNVHHGDPTGRRPSDLPPVKFGRMLDAHYRACVVEKKPFVHVIMLDSPERFGTYARLLLPLSEDGTDVTMLMTLNSIEQNTQALRAFFEEARKPEWSGSITHRAPETGT